MSNSNTSTRFVGLKAMADGSLLRTATLYDKPYIVVPIVSAVGDQVWWPANSPVAELVPAEVLEAGYWSRNNRPIVAGHPRLNGEYVSANSPEILETYAYGHLFAAKFDDKRVKVEAWFNKERANEVGPAAVDVISRLEAGEQIEVSEGNMVVSIDEIGELGGKEYKSKWISAICDHLATVSEGACNNQMGCGGPRVNEQKSHFVTGLSIASSREAKMKDSESKKSFFSRLFGSALSTLKSAMSNNELRMKLYRAVEQVDQGVMYVDDEDVEAKTFRYCVVIRYGDYYDESMEHHYYQRSFSLDESDNVTIGDDRIEVEWFQGWREVTTNSESEMIVSESEPATCTCSKEKEEAQVNVSEKKTLITRLIGAAKSPFEESDRTMLEGMKDEKLTSLISVYEGEANPAPVETAPAQPTQSQTTSTQPTETSTQVSPDQVVISKAQYEVIMAAANAHQAQQERYRSSLVTSIKAAQSAFTEDDMKVMSTEQLEKLATTLNVNEPATVDYSVRGTARPTVTDKKDHTPPKSWDLAMAERNDRNKSTATN